MQDQSPERLKLHMKNMNTFDVKTLRAKGGPCDGDYYGREVNLAARVAALGGAVLADMRPSDTLAATTTSDSTGPFNGVSDFFSSSYFSAFEKLMSRPDICGVM